MNDKRWKSLTNNQRAFIISEAKLGFSHAGDNLSGWLAVVEILESINVAQPKPVATVRGNKRAA